MSDKNQDQAHEFKQPQKRSYEKPELRDYGDIGWLTQARGAMGLVDGAVSGPKNSQL
jgi:hypothetical protein